MSTAADQLRLAARAVQIHGPRGYAWRGEPVDGPPDADARGDGLVANLAQRLYERFYLTGARLHAPHVTARPQPWLCELPVAIADALSHRRRAQSGWRQVDVDGDRVVLHREGIRVWADPADVVRGDGDALSLRMAVDLPMRSFGFHTVLGAAEFPQRPAPRDRWYWHLQPRSTVDFVTAVCEALDPLGVPFHLKVLADPDLYARCDGGVLTTPRAAREAVLDVTARLVARFADDLDPAVPALTLRLAPGLGFAEDPHDGGSFGIARCTLMATALWEAFLGDARSDDERADAVRAGFTQAGLHPDRPHLGPDGGDDPHLPTPSRRRRRHTVVRFDDVAVTIGLRLHDTARWTADRCTWIAPHPDSRERSGFVTRDLDPTWHAGTAGVAWFLAQLWGTTGESWARRTALGAMRQSLARCDDVPPADRDGLFAGWVGMAVAAARVGSLMGDPELLEAAAHLVHHFPLPPVHDVVEGRAGALAGVLALDDLAVPMRGEGRIQTLAGALLDAPTVLRTDRDAGAAHGLAGMACALDAAADRLGDAGLLHRARGMRERVRRFGPAREVGWCRGAAGLALCGLHEQVWLRTLVDGAREHVAERHPDVSLCHGVMGMADCLLTMSRRRPDLTELHGLAEWVGRETARGVLRAATPAWPCGPGRETPGLFAGMAGIGLTYLRLADPAAVSPLELACPAPAADPITTSARREPAEC